MKSTGTTEVIINLITTVKDNKQKISRNINHQIKENLNIKTAVQALMKID